MYNPEKWRDVEPLHHNAIPTVDERRQTLAVLSPVLSGLQILRGDASYYGLGAEQPRESPGYAFAGGLARRR